MTGRHKGNIDGFIFGGVPLVSLLTMLGKKENTALFLVININAAIDQGKQKSTFFMDSSY